MSPVSTLNKTGCPNASCLRADVRSGVRYHIDTNTTPMARTSAPKPDQCPTVADSAAVVAVNTRPNDHTARLNTLHAMVRAAKEGLHNLLRERIAALRGARSLA